MTGDRQRWILHADMDAFYASVEQRDNPELRGKPVIVGAHAARGVVMAASYEAREFGVRSAMAGFRAHELCPDGIYVRPNMEKYSEASRQVHRVFEEFTPDIEPIALDEAFLDISGSVELFKGPVRLGRKLRQRVREQTQLPISVGIAPTKLVAKIACKRGKPDGMLCVPPDAVEWLLKPLPVGWIWGVGPVLQRKLHSLGIYTVGQLESYDPAWLRSLLGERAAELQRMARGEDRRRVHAHRPARSYGEENTFATDVTDRTTVTGAITAHAESVARRMRSDGWHGRTITLKIKLARRQGERPNRLGEGEPGEPIYPLLTRSRTLRQPTDDGKLIRDVAVELWDQANVLEPVRLLGVSLSNLEKRQFEQLDLFAEREQTDRLSQAMDAIRDRFGKAAIGRAVGEPEKMTPAGQRKRGD